VSTTAVAPKAIRSTIPARLDRLSWPPFHTRMVAGLGSAWILDGLQITIASSVTGVLIQSDTLDMTSTEVGLIASVYLVGQVVGALVFGRLSDQLGRKRLLVVTLLLYLFGTGLAAFTVNDGGWLWLVYFYGTRFIAGMGIGGQYAAINSAIDEMMPSKYRGRVDIWINGSYWAGAILGSFASLVFLNAFAPDVGWRLAFLLGPVLALVVLVVARTLPESPRWLMTHGRGKLTATSQTFCWIVIFFFASAGASAAYLTVSETWPIEIRAEAIAAFFAIAQIFGAFGPLFYGALIGDGSSPTGLYVGYVVGGAIMVLGGIVELAIGIKAEGKSLEAITKPITSTAEPAPAAT
jgi:MFS family permease